MIEEIEKIGYIVLYKKRWSRHWVPCVDSMAETEERALQKFAYYFKYILEKQNGANEHYWMTWMSRIKIQPLYFSYNSSKDLRIDVE